MKKKKVYMIKLSIFWPNDNNMPFLIMIATVKYNDTKELLKTKFAIVNLIKTNPQVWFLF